MPNTKRVLSYIAVFLVLVLVWVFLGGYVKTPIHQVDTSKKALNVLARGDTYLIFQELDLPERGEADLMEEICQNHPGPQNCYCHQERITGCCDQGIPSKLRI